MKKMFWICGLLLLLTACGQREEAVEGNLILTNSASSEEAVSDTQLCAFTLPEGEDRSYTVSFETAEGNTVSGNFTDDFTGGNTVYLRADQEDGVWRLEYDEVS